MEQTTAEKPDRKNNSFSLPQIQLPKGGGEIKGMGEKFSNNPVTGTSSFSIPLPFSPGIAGMQPGLQVQYDSGSGNGAWGLGWTLSIPSVSRSTNKGIPTYNNDTDIFQFSGAEDLVPVSDSEGISLPEKSKTDSNKTYKVKSYRPRTEGAFVKIERWTDIDSGEIHWRTLNPANVLSIYGMNAQARISDPVKEFNSYQWFLEEIRDNKGQSIVFEYKQENGDNIPEEYTEEKIRAEAGKSFTQKYLKTIHYGKAPSDSGRTWLFHAVFDYGEHDEFSPELIPSEAKKWLFRKDSFSSYRAGFEIRTMRLCRRVIVFHDFPELGDSPVAVRSVDFFYNENEIATFVHRIQTKGYRNGETLAMPPMELEYEPLKFNTEVKQLPEQQTNFYSGNIDYVSHQWADLYGEGMPGLLYHDGESIRFRSNLGNGIFAPEKVVSTFPSLTKDAMAPVLMDLDEDGQLDFFIKDTAAVGYYSFKENQYENFNAFREFPKVDTTNLKWMDVDGDGSADMLLLEENSFVWYRKTIAGFSERRQTALPKENDKPVRIFNDHRQAYFFADMSGDGLPDLVRVRNGEVCYWPNLGHARFGAKVLMRNNPVFSSIENFSPSHVRLADLDGSGPSDIIYFGENKIQIYTNESGNSLADEFSFSSPASRDILSSSDLVDLMGNGTVCIVWTSDLPNSRGLKYIDLLGGKKPHLLLTSKNNMGGETRYTYTSSTKFYREDEAKGQAWITRLPFPVHVVSHIESIDHLTGKRFGKRYAYHHGYYDVSEKEFRGFGMVEQWDTEEYDWFSEEGDKEAKEYYVPPVFTRTWFHTGAWDKRERFTKQYNEEYYKGDAEAFSLEDSIILDYEKFSIKEKREAFRALRGMTLRQEVYSEDGSSREAHPYTVSETRVRVKKVQASTQEHYGVFMVEQMESLSINYDRDPGDPRISHALQLEHDLYGKPTRSASVVYPRRERDEAFPEQLKMHILIAESSLLHQDTDKFYLLGLPISSKSFELGGVHFNGTLLQQENLRSQVSQAFNSIIPFDQQLNRQDLELRLISYSKVFYWNEQRTQSLPNKTISTSFPPLVHHEETAMFGIQQFRKVFEGKATEDELLEGGYKIEEDHAWISGPVIFYKDQVGYYLPYETKDVLGTPSRIVWDKYFLMPVSAIDALENTVTGIPDYHILSFNRMIDINGTVTEALPDALGQVIASTIYGDTLGKQEGDLPIENYVVIKPSNLDEVVENPHKFLQDATTYFWYDLWAYYERKEAPSSISLQREMHVHALESGIVSPVQISITYAGGEGGAQSKLKVEGGLAFLRNDDGSLKLENGKPVLGESEVRWLSSGRAVLNNKGKAVKQYEPFYSTTHRYESERELTDYGISPFIHYDAIGRVTRTDLPDGTFSHVEFDSWKTISYDPQDNVLESQWYKDRGSPDPNGPEPADAKQRAAWLAAKHANTPSIAHADNLGRIFRAEVFLEGNKKLISLSTFDINGALLTQTDARQVVLNASREEQCVNFQHENSMGLVLQSKSADAGEGWILPDGLGRVWKSWNSKKLLVEVKYDLLNRVSQTIHSFEGNRWTSEYLQYGDTEVAAASKNFKGKLIRYYHSGGLNETLEVNFKGEVTKVMLQLTKNYKDEPDWSSLLQNSNEYKILLEDTAYVSVSLKDAVGRTRENIGADNTVFRPEFYTSGLLKSISLTPKGIGRTIQLVKEIKYNEKNLRANIVYGNDVITKYTYEPLNYRLANISTRRKNGSILQNLNYTYDSVGNITTLYDAAQQVIFNNNQEVLAKADYTYDALYRLIKARGREHKALRQTALFSKQWENDWVAFLNPQGSPDDPNFLANYIQHYTYDDADNLIAMMHTGANSFTRNVKVSDTSNRAVLEDNLNGRAVQSFFDARGNLKEMEHLRSMEWTSKDQLKSVVLIDRSASGLTNDAEYYVYGADGKRIRKVAEFLEHGNTRIRTEEKVYLNGIQISRVSYKSNNTIHISQEKYLIDGLDDQQKVALIHYWTIDETSTNMSGQMKVHYQLYNHLGSASMEVDESPEALLISYEEYYPYGETAFQLCRSSVEIKWKQYRYTGMERDEYSGLSYHSARYYAPWMGRWLNPDPSGTIDGLNLYRYVKGNPIRYIDRSGNECTTEQTCVTEEDDEKFKHIEETEKEEAWSQRVFIDVRFDKDAEMWVYIPMVNPQMREYYERRALERIERGGWGIEATDVYDRTSMQLDNDVFMIMYPGFKMYDGPENTELIEFAVIDGKPRLMSILPSGNCACVRESAFSPIDLVGTGLFKAGAKVVIGLVKVGTKGVAGLGTSITARVLAIAGKKGIVELSEVAVAGTTRAVKAGVYTVGAKVDRRISLTRFMGISAADISKIPTAVWMHGKALMHGGLNEVKNLFTGTATANQVHLWLETFADNLAKKLGKEVTIEWTAIMKEGTEHIGETLYYTLKVGDNTYFSLVIDLTREYDLIPAVQKFLTSLPK